MNEIYNIRDLKLCIKEVMYTPTGARCRLHNSFIDLNVYQSKYVFLIYSGRTKFIELGFNDASVYKVLRWIFKDKSINDIILKLGEYVQAIRK